MRTLLAIAAVVCAVAVAVPAAPAANPLPPGKAQLLTGLRLQVSVAAQRFHRQCGPLRANAKCLHQAQTLVKLRARMHALQQLPAQRLHIATGTD